MALTKHQLKFNSTVGKCDEIKSFLATDNGGLLTSTTAGGKEALDVNIAASDINITTTESDVYAEDSAHTSGDEGTFGLALRVDDLDAVPASLLAGTEGDYQGYIVGPSGALKVSDREVLSQLQTGVTVSDGGGSITVDGTVAATQSGAWSVDIADGGGSITVDAVDLDIRDLSAATDSVAAWAHDGLGNALESLNGHLKVVDCTDTVTYSSQALTGAAAATAVAAVSGQSFMEIQNLSDEPVYMVGSGATAASPGILIPCGGTWSGKVCGAVNLYSDATIAAADLQIAQYALS